MTGKKPEKKAVHARKRKTFGFLYNFQSPLSSNNLLRGIDDYAAENGLNILAAVGAPLDPVSASDKKRIRIFDFLGKENIDAVIMSRKVSRSLSGPAISGYLKKFRPLPVVNIGNQGKGVPAVSYSIRDSIRTMVLHLTQGHGFKKILFVRGRESNHYARERFASYCKIMKTLKMRVHYIEPKIDDYYYEGGKEAVRILIVERKERYQAIIAENNLMALGILDALKTYGIDVPGDIAVTGTYELEAENPFEIPITSLFVPFYDHGRLAAELCHDRIRGRRVKTAVTTPVGLRIGTTCGCFFPEARGGDEDRPKAAASVAGVFPVNRREELVKAVTDAAGHYRSGKKEILVQFVVVLVEAFEEELVRGRRDVVSKVLNAYAGILGREGFDLLLLQKILALFYEKIVLSVADPMLAKSAIALYFMTYYIIYKTVHNEESYRLLSESQKSLLVGKMEEELFTSSTMERIREIAVSKFPALGVTGFFLAVHEKRGTTPFLRPVMALIDGKELTVGEKEKPVKGPLLLKKFYTNYTRRFTLLAAPLFYGEEEPGIALFELANNDLNTLEKLRNGLSVALLNTFHLQDIEHKTLDLKAQVMARNKELVAANERLEGEIAERQRAEKKLRKSEEEYRRWFNESFTADFVSDGTGKISACNQSFARIFEFASVEEARRAHFADFYPVASAVEDFFTLLAVVKKIEYYEAELVTAKGTHINIIGHIIGTFDKNGNLLEMRGFLVDNSPHKHLEEELRQTQKMEAIGRLSGGIAHDFNNLLTGIMGYSELLLQLIGEKEPGRKEVEEIKKAAKSASSLTRQLLAFSRKQVLSPVVLNLNDVILGMNDMLTRLIGETIRLRPVLSPELKPVKADRGQLEQVIMNLVINSRDALPQGGEITIKSENMTIETAVRLHDVLLKAGEYVCLEIVDNGNGMSEDIQAHLFEPFFTTKTVGKGVGLGLSTVYGIVTQSAGSLEIESAPGQGTTVKVCLPVYSAETKPGEAASVSGPARQFKGRVLVVEDDKNIRELTRLILAKRGFDVGLAEDGEKALALFNQSDEKYDLVITDVVMPKMSGNELVEQLLRENKDLKVIYISGYSAVPATRKLRLNKNAVFLQKPFSPDMLLQAIKRLL